jgi:transposase
MTKKQYSLDLRERVIEYIKSGNEQKTTSKIFKVSKSSISRWWIRYKKEGTIRPKLRLGSRGKIDPEELRIYVETNEDKTLAEIAKVFNASICSVYRRLKKLGFSYKKKPSPIWKLPAKKRDEYQEAIKDIDPKSLVYIDESGIEMTICKDRGWGKIRSIAPRQEERQILPEDKYHRRDTVNNKSIAPMVFNGSCNTDLFNSLGRTISDKGTKARSSCNYG